jgi:C-5 cytosine-specific DNA methylase
MGNTMSRPRLLDLFCGAGGAALGYQLAGFHVTGVDIAPQPHYCGDAFYQADAMTFPLDGFDVVTASPPCQAYSTLGRFSPHVTYPDLYEPTRERLTASGLPWVIENVVGAPYRSGFILCGSMFGLRVRRHRNFETRTRVRATFSDVRYSAATCRTNTSTGVSKFWRFQRDARAQDGDADSEGDGEGRRAIGDAKPFVLVAMGTRTTDGLVVCRLSQLGRLVEALVNL